MSLVDLTATALAEQLAAGTVSAREVVTAFVEQTAAVNPRLNAILAFQPEAALSQAAAIDERRARGETLGPLAGLPVGIKDNLAIEGAVVACGSRMLEHFRPPYDAHVVTALRQADAVLFGRTNMDEFAMGSSTENSYFGPTRNPWDSERVPGGSSGGSASAVAARAVPVALGSDTGGSIRQPAGLTGTVGLKPTYGRISRFGLVAFASSLDQIGPMTRTVEDAALLLSVLAGPDPRDSTCSPEVAPDYRALLRQPLEGLRLGIVSEHFGPGLDPEIDTAVRAAIDQFRAQGADIREVHLPNTRHAIATYYLVATAEASSNLARYDGVHFGHRASTYTDLTDMVMASRGEGFGAEVKRRILLGTFCLSQGYRDAYYLKALQLRRLIKADFDRAFEDVDVIVGPVTPTPAFTIGEKAADPLAMYLSDIYTVSTNLAGIPALALPCGFTSGGLPIGLQLQAPAFAEPMLLRVGHAYQQWTDWHERRPPLGM